MYRYVFSRHTRLVYFCQSNPTDFLMILTINGKLVQGRRQTNSFDLLRRNQVYSKQAALKKRGGD